jgi:hypothetical protein
MPQTRETVEGTSDSGARPAQGEGPGGRVVSAVVVAAVLLPDAAGGLLGRVQPWVVGTSPGTVISQIVGGAELPTSQIYPAGAWAATMVLVAAAVVGTGAIALVRRDG